MSVSTVMARVVVDAVERLGVARDELFRGLAIEATRLEQADGRFDLEEYAALQTRAMDLTNDEALGLHIAERTHETAFDLMAHLVSHAPTLREAFGLCAQFQRILMDDSHVTLKETRTSASMEFHFTRVSDRADRMQAELAVAGFLRFVRVFGGHAVTPELASFEHERPAHHREYARVFGDVVRFEQPATGLTFDRSILDREQIHQHPELFQVLLSQAERALERVAVGLRPVDQVRRYLMARPPARIPAIGIVAHDLGLSVRSLRRRLATEATTYRSIVRGILEESAGFMLRDPKRSIQETALALGFSNVGAFHRAFKRWTGMTPAQYRKQQSGKATADPTEARGDDAEKA
jgi:AraC-like DNA-binding protein